METEFDSAEKLAELLEKSHELHDGWTFADGTPFGMKEDGTKTE